MTKKTENTQLAISDPADVMPAGYDLEFLAENFDDGVDEMEFPRINVNSQVSRFFFGDSDDEGAETFEGVLLFHGKQNTYWGSTYDPNNITPPICFATDGKVGSLPRNEEGMFGNCADCQNNQFGSGQGKGKACRNMRKLYVYVPGKVVPYTLFLPPTSITAFDKKYLVGSIIQQGRVYYQVLTRFKLYKNNPRDTYSLFSFEVASHYEGAALEEVKKLREFWLDAIKHDRTRLDTGHASAEENTSSTTQTQSGQDREVHAKQPVPADDVSVEDDDVPF